MSYNSTQPQPYSQSLLEVKSKYDAEFRRFGLNRIGIGKFDEFYHLLERLHGLYGIQFNICYTDKDGDLLPINNDNNLARVLHVTMGVLRLIILRKGECYPDNQYSNMNYSNHSNIHTAGSNTTSYRASNLITHIKELSTTLTSSSHTHQHGYNSNMNSNKPFVISYPEDFRPVSAIIDVDILPDTYRRVRLHKHKSSKPLGFYIRDGRSLRVTPHGVEQVPGIFISRLMAGGLAESTGLLSVNDEVIEVNGIEVAGKTLDQVTDMMVANSSNLIITVKPTNQKYNLNRANASMSRAPLPVMNKRSSVNSSFSSLNNKGSFKSVDNCKKLQSVADNEQILLDIKSDVKIKKQFGVNDLNSLKNNEFNEYQNDDDDEDDDEDEDEEIHDAPGNNGNSSDHDNSDDKILTL